MTKNTKSKRRKVGADVWLNKNSWRKGTEQHKKEKAERPARIAEHREQRAANGYSWDDWINFDSFIAGIIANAVLDFAENGVGYFPIGGEEMNEDFSYSPDVYENFKATCGAIYFALTEWLDWDNEGLMMYLDANPGDYKGSNVIAATKYEEAREAMILFSEHLGHWWD